MKLWGKTKPGLVLGVATILLLAGAALWRGNIIRHAGLGNCALDQSTLGAFIDIPGGWLCFGCRTTLFGRWFAETCVRVPFPPAGR